MRLLAGRSQFRGCIRNSSLSRRRLFRENQRFSTTHAIFFPCQSEEECNLLYEPVASEPARAFWSSFIFRDAKRPITAQRLNSLNLSVLARILGKECDIARTIAERQIAGCSDRRRQACACAAAHPNDAACACASAEPKIAAAINHSGRRAIPPRAAGVRRARHDLSSPCRHNSSRAWIAGIPDAVTSPFS